MTDEEKLIVETLRYCEESGARCESCPSGKNREGVPNCHSQSRIADLIERLSDELEQAQQENAGLEIMLTAAQSAAETWKRIYEAIQRDFGEFVARINAGEDMIGCEYCKKNYAEGECSCNCLKDFEWRVQKEDA